MPADAPKALSGGELVDEEVVVVMVALALVVVDVELVTQDTVLHATL